ncbi:MAG: cupredoxin domain-containing protein [bacterium]|nr:cupredoxin domain-containing protein [bacterium]
MKNSNDTKEDNKITRPVLIVIAVLLFVGLGFVVSGSPKSSAPNETVQNVEIKEGVQYVTINAKGGYIPRVSSAKAGIPTKLVMNTAGTFDCSSSLSIPELGLRKMLPQNGETEIDLGVRQVGTLQGLCSMGMYNFEINFI